VTVGDVNERGHAEFVIYILYLIDSDLSKRKGDVRLGIKVG